MIGHLVRRVGGAGLTLLVVALFVFVAVQVVPGDPARVVVGPDASPEDYAAARTRLGLDTPWPVRFVSWVGAFVAGDWGDSLLYNRPVRPLVLSGLAVTLPLAGLALGMALLLALPLGTIAAGRVGGWLDMGTVGFLQLGTALPEFWLGILLVGLVAVAWRLLPAGGFPGWGEPRAVASLVLPALSLALPRGAYLARMVRASLADVLAEDYVRSARAKGLPELRIVAVHALRNALVPILTTAGLTLARLVAGAMVVENVFGLPGLGRLTVVAVEGRDLPLLASAAAVVAGLVVIVSLVVDLGYALLDPRMRER
ncbi:MAG TPA: ABC transporter permease [Candidatus Acetothermia bacterium]|nr:ABC transporter permease [Candidatus Acetothermia bacterium]